MKTQLLKGIALASLVTVMATPLHAQTAGETTQPAQPAAQPAAEQAMGEEAGYGVGAALASIFYIPAKVTYAGLGLLTGGLGYLFSGGRADVANNIIYPAVGGNYVVTPSHLRGKEPIYFVGAPPPLPETGSRAEAPVSEPTVTR